MAKAKGVKKFRSNVVVRVAAPHKAPAKVVKRPGATGPEPTPSAPETSLSEAQDQVAASKFALTQAGARKPAPRPTLPTSYGESHLLLLVRDPQTLFAAWDMTPSTIDGLKARLGLRAYAVSTLTLRLIRAGGSTSLIHVGKKTRSRYLKVDGGPSFIAEIGFTPPSGRFELIARSAPCFVPLGPNARLELPGPAPRSMLGYREAKTQARRQLAAPVSSSGAPSKMTRSAPAKSAASASAAASSLTPRVQGGASDLYRR